MDLGIYVLFSPRTSELISPLRNCLHLVLLLLNLLRQSLRLIQLMSTALNVAAVLHTVHMNAYMDMCIHTHNHKSTTALLSSSVSSARTLCVIPSQHRHHLSLHRRHCGSHIERKRVLYAAERILLACIYLTASKMCPHTQSNTRSLVLSSRLCMFSLFAYRMNEALSIFG